VGARALAEVAAELVDHVDRAGVDGDAVARDELQRGAVDLVGGEHDPGVLVAGVVAGVQRALDLAGRHRIHLHAEAAQQPQHVRVGAGLLREAHGVERAQAFDAGADGVGVVHPQRRGVGLRQRLQALGCERGGGGVLERRHVTDGARKWHIRPML